MKNIDKLEISFDDGFGEFGIHDGFFNTIVRIDNKQYYFQCCSDNNKTVDFEDCGYDWGICGDQNSELADVIGWYNVLILLKRAYKEWQKKG